MKTAEKMLIIRTKKSEYQTLGIGLLLNEKGEVIYKFVTLELPYNENKHNISCIPEGTYKADKYKSFKLGDCIRINHVYKRDNIRLHKGNYKADIQGCVLVGQYYKDIDFDKHLDVVLSSITLNEILSKLPREFEMEIR